MRDLLRGYTSPEGRFNEVQDAAGQLRPHWEDFAAGVGTLIASPIAWEQADRMAQLRALAELAG